MRIKCAPGVHYLGVHYVTTIPQVCTRCAPVCTAWSVVHYQINAKCNYWTVIALGETECKTLVIATYAVEFINIRIWCKVTARTWDYTNNKEKISLCLKYTKTKAVQFSRIQRITPRDWAQSSQGHVYIFPPYNKVLVYSLDLNSTALVNPFNSLFSTEQLQI